MKFQPAFSLIIAFSLLTAGLTISPSATFAGSSNMTDALEDATSKKAQLDQATAEKETDAVKEGFRQLKNAMAEDMKQKQREELDTAAIHDGLVPAMNNLSTALTQDENVVKYLMNIRSYELNRIPLAAQPSSTLDDNTIVKTDYLADTSWDTPIDAQAFDIFMRYFCDPNARGGTMKDFSSDQTNVNHGGTSTLTYTLKCGEISTGDLTTRHKLLGSSDDTTPQAIQVLALPSRPADLFLEPRTFPTTLNSTAVAGAAAPTNTNPMSGVYYGAFAASLRFLVGSYPPGVGGLGAQQDITRKMLASYPFAVLFAERSGSMGKDAVQALATHLSKEMNAGSSTDPAVQAYMADLKGRQNISTAEYMNIVMYQLPTSPGYYTHISEELSQSDLRREEVWLTALQTALGYQRNRWLEILATLEASK
jgi:hypothetical protein